MRILVVAPFVPWPLAHGGRIRLFHLVRELARCHEVSLVCLADSEEQETGPLAEFCLDVVTVVHRHNPMAEFCRFLFGPNPYNVERFVSPALAATARRLLASTPFDIIHLETTHIWPVAEACGDLPVVLGTQNVESRILAQLESVCRNPLKRLLYRLETARMRRFEEHAWRSCRLCLAVSEAERQEIVNSGVPAERVVTVANGVDTARFAFAQRPGGKRLLFLGGLDYHPNRDAADWLLGEIWPIVRRAESEAQLLLAGRGTDAVAMAGPPAGVTCIGDPEDVSECFAGADILLVPLRIGAGTRLKVLEAMAAGLPVITTSRGCEGTLVQAGEHLLVADTPQDFAAACLRLLADPGLAGSLAVNARRLVEEHYGWAAIGADLATTYSELLNSGREGS